MADLKISALTASTTPLAGTEVLPIVQSGTTKKVSVADLTAGRAVSMLSATAGNVQVSGNTIVTTDTNGNLTINPNGTGYTVLVSATNGTIAQWGDTTSRTYYVKSANVGGFDNDTLINESDSGVGQFQWKNSGGVLATLAYTGNYTLNTGNLILGTSGKGITNSTGSVALNFSTAGTSLNSPQSVLSGSFPNVGSAQTITISDTNGGYVVITGVQGGVGSSTWTLPFAKRGGSIAIGTPSKAILTADPILTVAGSGGNIVVTPLAGNTYFTYAIYYTPLGA